IFIIHDEAQHDLSSYSTRRSTDLIIRRLDFNRDDRVDATYVEHAQILDALRTGHASEAADRLTTHIRISQKAVREISMERIREAAEAHKIGQKMAQKTAVKQ